MVDRDADSAPRAAFESLITGWTPEVHPVNALNSARISSSISAGSRERLRDFLAQQFPVALAQAMDRHPRGALIQAQPAAASA